jgi:hypothetical protein
MLGLDDDDAAAFGMRPTLPRFVDQEVPPGPTHAMNQIAVRATSKTGPRSDVPE